jgi:hypothetical protein
MRSKVKSRRLMVLNIFFAIWLDVLIPHCELRVLQLPVIQTSYHIYLRIFP